MWQIQRLLPKISFYNILLQWLNYYSKIWLKKVRILPVVVKKGSYPIVCLNIKTILTYNLLSGKTILSLCSVWTAPKKIKGNNRSASNLLTHYKNKHYASYSTMLEIGKSKTKKLDPSTSSPTPTLTKHFLLCLKKVCGNKEKVPGGHY